MPWVVYIVHGIHTAYVHDLESRMALLQKSTSTVKQKPRHRTIAGFFVNLFVLCAPMIIVIFDKGYLNSEGEILMKAQATYKYRLNIPKAYKIDLYVSQ